jgi:hypothetical protein
VEANSGLGKAIRYLQKTLGEADVVLAPARSAVGFQHRGAGFEESDFESEEWVIL